MRALDSTVAKKPEIPKFAIKDWKVSVVCAWVPSRHHQGTRPRQDWRGMCSKAERGGAGSAGPGRARSRSRMKTWPTSLPKGCPLMGRTAAEGLLVPPQEPLGTTVSGEVLVA